LFNFLLLLIPHFRRLESLEVDSSTVSASSLDPSAWSATAALVARLAARFSPVALTSLIIVAATGVVNGWLYVPDPRDLVRSAYGVWLSTKVALFVALVGIAAYNGLVAVPRLSLDRDQPLRALQRFRRGLAAEGIVAVLVLAAA